MSATLPFPMPLAEKYRPRVIGDFVGLDKPKRILSKFAANPYASVWLFVGPPVTSLSFCTTVDERLYITPSSGKGSNGGSEGAVGDRRAAICGANAVGAGGL